MTSVLEKLGGDLITLCEEAGDTLLLFARTTRDCRFAMRHPDRVVQQMKRAGNDTLVIASGIAIFIGMVISLQVGDTLRTMRIESAVSKVVSYSMITEMGPAITALLLAGRVGASIAAEIATMQIDEEIDALHTLGISPIRFLAVPRFLACVLTLPILVAYASLLGIVGGGVIANATFGIGWHNYLDGAFSVLDFQDIAQCVLKSLIFGAIVATVACQRGFRTRGGAEGVGRAITSSVVTSFICIIVADYFVTRLML